MKKSSIEYRKGKYTGAEEVGTSDQLENLEHVEEEVEKKSWKA